MLAETRIDQVRGKSLLINGLIKRRGVLEDLTDDTLKFAIADEDTMLAIVTKSTGAGITQTSGGQFTIEILPTEVERLDLPKESYWFEIEITEPDGRRWPIARGPYVMHDSPFS